MCLRPDFPNFMLFELPWPVVWESRVRLGELGWERYLLPAGDLFVFLTDLFEMYVERYKRETHPEDKKRLKRHILKFLKEDYFFGRDQLDFDKIIDAIPDGRDFNVHNSQGEGLENEEHNSLYNFLSSITSYILHQKRTYACTK